MVIMVWHLKKSGGWHIKYNQEHPVGRLMHDFNCKEAKEIVNPLLAEEARCVNSGIVRKIERIR
nr:hypothetical protein [uncultured Blautia sp.]